MQQAVPLEGVMNVPETQLQPTRPDADAIFHHVADYFACDIEHRMARTHRKGYLLAVYLLRREVNMPLASVAAMFEISISRVSQIQQSFWMECLAKSWTRCLKSMN
ncbi:MAG: hypothetical protein R8K53_00630 [Mariprofundaceae bacterium]